ncbi:MAG TPA: hypothetical protein VGC41_27515 [Kofleriaceae bacterium]
MGGFSFASVILSYFLAAGGLLTGTLVIGYTHQSSQVVQLLLWAAGSLLGGFVAARASRGSTILEPAIGTIGLAATIVFMIAGSDAGKLMWHAGEVTSTGKIIAEIVGALVVGSLVGAFLSEKILGEATTSSIPWVLYSALTAFGAAFVGTFIAVVLFAKGEAATYDTLAKMMLAGVGIGALLGGLAVGASARTRPLIAAFLGGAVGVAGFFLMITVGEAKQHDADVQKGIAVLAVGGAIVMLVGAVGGWFTFGKRNA